MIQYKLQNLQATSVIINDIGVTLQARGGSDSIKIVDEYTYINSVDIRDLIRRGWIRSEIQNQSIVVIPIRMKKEESKSVESIFPVVVESKNTGTPNQSYEELNLKLELLIQTIGSLTQQLQNIPQTSQIVTVQDGYQKLSNTAIQTESISEPMFIPSQIISKDNSEMSVKTESGTRDGAGMENAAKKLKALRSK